MTDRTFRLDYRKWPDTEHWQLDMHRLGEDEHGVWLGMPAGGTGRRGAETPVVYRGPFVVVVPHSAWWTSLFTAEGHPKGVEVYVDITMPASFGQDRVTVVDLDLDLVRLTGERIVVLDEDEFEDHQVSLSYPPELVTGATESLARVHDAVRARQEPFDEVGPGWLARFLNGA